jgi:hypothetical protein
MTALLGFIGTVLTVLGCGVAASGNLGAGIGFLNWAFTLFTLAALRVTPKSAFERAHRGSKAVWMLSGLVGLIPPLGFTYFLAWVAIGRTVNRAWAAEDPASYKRFRQRRRLDVPADSSNVGQSRPWQTSSSTTGGPCGVCGGRGWHYSDGGGNTMRCHACGGSGRR